MDTLRARLLLAFSIACLAICARPEDAVAHQCDVLGKSPDVEISFIRAHPDVLLFCQSCGDKAPTPFHVEKVRTASKAGEWPVQIDITDRAGRTRRVGVSTVYVRLDPKTRVFTNVSNRAVCRDYVTPHTITP